MKLQRLLLSGLTLIIASTTAFAQSQSLPRFINPLQPQWIIEEITDGSVLETVVPDEREIATGGLPDGRITTGNGDIAEAWYSEPTTRYAHGALGDAIEASALKIRTALGEVFTYRPPSTEVFEDIAPRLADLDRDGRTEVITILTSRRLGASVAIFNLNGNAFTKVVQTPFIGQPNRWLNIAGIDHFGGSRRPDIALVVTPHLQGVLQFYRYQSGRLVRVAQAAGFSNHVIGSNELRLSAVADVNGNDIPDLILPSLERNALVMFGIRQRAFAELARIPLPARIDRAIGTREAAGKLEIILGLDDGKTYAVKWD